MARLMCGHEIVRRPAAGRQGPVVLALAACRRRAMPACRAGAATISVQGGEIAALRRSPATARAPSPASFAGMLTPSEGRVAVRASCHRFTPHAMVARGVGRIPEDRMTEGLVTALPLADSLCCRASATPPSAARPDQARSHPCLRRGTDRAFDIRCPGPMVRAGSLSGGNLQKALLARELAFDRPSSSPPSPPAASTSVRPASSTTSS